MRYMTTKECKRIVLDHEILMWNKTRQIQRKEEGGFMRADMLRVPRKRAQTLLSAFSLTRSHLGILLSL